MFAVFARSWALGAMLRELEKSIDEADMTTTGSGYKYWRPEGDV